MAKTLNKLINEIYGDRPVKGPEKAFIDKHVITQFGVTSDGKDFAGNKVDGPPYKASNQTHTRFPRHGYDPGADKKVYEEHDEQAKKLYHQHKKEFIKHAMSAIDHIEKHGQTLDRLSGDDDWSVRHPYHIMKDFSRRMQDLTHDLQTQASYTINQPTENGHSLKQRHQMGGTQYSNYKVNKPKKVDDGIAPSTSTNWRNR